MRRLVVPVALLALAPACSRNLEVPTRDRLSIEPAFATVSPREPLAFSATGGAGSYRFEFSQGGQLSGGDATVGSTSGNYRAGGAGSAQDVVRVVDAAGAVAEARVTVTAHLAALPGEAYVSPGGSLTPALSGGRLPYGFTLVRGPGSTAALISGTYVAGAEGDVLDEIAVNDGTGDPAASTTITVHVGPRVRLYPPAATVAPGEALAFVGLGGSAPHTFGIRSASGGTISPTGAYVAGATGGVVDHVTITDGNGQVAVADVTVGPALRIDVAAGALRPGVTAPLLASGGKAPYRFAFAPRGNRSLGAVVEQTGDYVPGQNTGARDRVMVTDAVGATAVRDLPAIGGLQVHVGPGAARCIAADLNGDRRGDVVVVAEDTTYAFAAARSLSLPVGSGAVEAPVGLPRDRVHDQVLVADFNGSGRDQLVFFGPNGLWSLAPDAAGNLVFGPSLPASTFFAGAAQGWQPVALFRGTTVNRILTSAPCNGGAGLWRVDWTVGASSPGAPACEPLSLGAGTSVFAMAAADLNGDGRADLAWVESTGANYGSVPVKVALAQPGGGFGAPLSYTIPGGAVGIASRWPWGAPEINFLGTPRGLYLLANVPGANDAQIHLLRAGAGGASPAWAAGYPLNSPAGGPFGLAARDDAGLQLAAWNLDGGLALLDVDAAGATTIVRSTAAAPTRCMAFPDVNGDGVRDLVAGDVASSTAEVLFGDGGRAYGQRAWFARDGAYAPLGDLDGDGRGDVLVASGDRSIRVLFGGAGQLAYGAETALPQPAVALAAGDLGAARSSAAVLDQAGTVRLLGLDPDGVVSSSSAPFYPFDLSVWTPIRMQVHDFGGAATGEDVFVALENGDRSTGAGYQAQVRYRDAGGATEQARTDLLRGNVNGDLWCEILAAGSGTTAEAVALCLASTHATAHLYRAVMVKGNWVAPWSAISAPALIGTGPNASLVAAGTLPTGEAVFVASPGVAAGSPPVYAVTVAPGGVVTVTSLAGASGPVTGAAMGPLRAGQQDLVVAAGGAVRTFLAAGAGSYTATATLGAAPGAPAAILPLRVPGTGDVLFATPDAFVPLVGDGAGNLQ